MSNNRFFRRPRMIAAAAATVSAVAIAAAPVASAGPTEGPNAQEVILQLQSQGDQVIVSRTGNKPLQQCVVTSVRQIDHQSWYRGPRLPSPESATRPGAAGIQLRRPVVHVEIRC
ncbi:hypothetical protein [Mycobacteroides abscessus]|uniref:hypothetical protein n=2 Tax=Mycobacteroides abscessus TaxID=36809 RepID=UPI0005DF6F7D|nr:hypothetical protein [Mycobacteroides abscessus]MBN7322848.1 hypothetical protein [Mycobacteroides abscessus subsp. massiliense]MBN7388198.1 hypothetical protein [Mycobacteroides abscessus subsp. abscessus]MBN7417657.1 hypothetical protein [Mycobacteroides abscessus subsp. abscessus]MBN7488755.1 hypothetical protein [Mycobacteroides abscessus subsp. abscessus]